MVVAILGHVHQNRIMMQASATNAELIVTKWDGNLPSLVAILFTTVTHVTANHTVNKLERWNILVFNLTFTAEQNKYQGQSSQLA